MEYHNSFYDDLARVLREMGTAEIAQATGYYSSMVRRLKRGECRPSAERLPGVLSVGALRARTKLAESALPIPERDVDVVGLYAGVKRRGAEFAGDGSNYGRG